LISFIEKDYEQLPYHRQQEQDHKRFDEAVEKEEDYRLFDEAVEKAIKMERDSFPLHKDFFTDFSDKKDQKRYYDRYFQKGMALYQAGQFTEAMPYILEVAQQGSAEAQIRLAHIYMNGEGVPKNVEESEYWLRQSRNH
jgi:TPR repeat protein